MGNNTSGVIVGNVESSSTWGTKLIKMITTEKQRKQFEEQVRPLIKWLAENFHPHTKIILESNRAELVEGSIVFVTDDYILD